MKIEQIINVDEVNIGSTLLLKNGKKVKVTGFCNSMLPTINKIYFLKTDLGNIKPDEVERIYK